jgi:hypothetical protein
VAVLVTATHLAAIRTESVNWDELALLFRASETIRTGQLQSGGREGLAVFVLLPFVRGCTSSVEAVTQARGLWSAFTLLAVAGLFFLVRAARGDPSWEAPALAVGLLVLVPAFLRWSLQVRTDQPALAFSLWAGVALLGARRRLAVAAVGGALFGLGYLFSQKALYVLALVLLLAAARLAARRLERRELAGAALFALAAAATVGLYRLSAPLVYETPPPVTLERGLGELALYRSLFGYRVYRAMLPTLVPHVLLTVLLVAASVRALRTRAAERGRLLVCWAVLGLGSVVGWFHGSAFPYFWMTLGLFPAVALALGWEILPAPLPEGRRAAVVGVAAWAMLLAASGPAAVALLTDTQAVQRRSLAFVERSFAPEDRGFHAEGALLCRADPSPFPIYFTSRIVRMYEGPEGRRQVDRLLEEFRSRPVKFMIAHRFMPFPKPVADYWKENYVLYRDEVLVPGRRMQGTRGARGHIEVPIDGRYKWWAPAGRILLDGSPLEPGQTASLAAGSHEIEFPEDSEGILAWALEEEPAPSPTPFYNPAAVREIDPPG